MHIRTDTDGRIVARRNSPPPGKAPGDWHEVDGDALAPPDTEPWQQAVPSFDGTAVTFEVVDRPANDPAQLGRRIDAMEKASGSAGEKGQRGIASRIDSLEDRIAALEG